MIFRLPFCLKVIDDIFTVLSLHFGVQCSLIVGLVFSSLRAADDADVHKSNLETMNRSGNVTGLTAINNGSVPVR